MIKLTINLFSPNIEKSCSFNITSCKSTNDEVASFLLNVEIIGREVREKFIEECIEDTTTFEKPIKRNKVHTFAIYLVPYYFSLFNKESRHGGGFKISTDSGNSFSCKCDGSMKKNT